MAKMACDDDLALKLDEEFDEYMEAVIQKNKGYRYDGGFTAENFDEEVKKVPAFLTEMPTQEEINASPALSALQVLKYEDEDPYESALAHKEDGNYHFKKKNYKKAVAAYTEGIKRNCDDPDLNAVLYTNRAAAQFYLGNYRSSLLDATEARKAKSDHMKAIIRGATCYMQLNKFEECVSWCDCGLKISFLESKYIVLAEQAFKQACNL